MSFVVSDSRLDTSLSKLDSALTKLETTQSKSDLVFVESDAALLLWPSSSEDKTTALPLVPLGAVRDGAMMKDLNEITEINEIAEIIEIVDDNNELMNESINELTQRHHRSGTS